jgi:hypothetical protein
MLSEQMKQAIRRSVVKVSALTKTRQREIGWSIAGVVLGVIAGLFVGGVGIAAGGSAFGVPASVILALLGGMIGNRIGVEKDKARSG